MPLSSNRRSSPSRGKLLILNNELIEKDSALRKASHENQQMGTLQEQLNALTTQVEAGNTTLAEVQAQKSELETQLAAAQAGIAASEELKAALEEKSTALQEAQAKLAGEGNGEAAQLASLQTLLAESEAAQRGCSGKNCSK